MKHYFLLLVIFNLLFSDNSSAQFVKNDLLTYQHNHGSGTSIVVQAKQGLLVVDTTDAKFSKASFDVEQMLSERTRGVFVKYADETTIPDSVVLPGEEQPFPVSGSFKLIISDSLTLSYTAISERPYLSVTSGKIKNQVVLGMLGREVIVNSYSGDNTRLFEASVGEKHPAIYSLSSDGLFVEGYKLSHGTRLGLIPAMNNICLKQGLSIKELGDDLKIRSSKDPSEFYNKYFPFNVSDSFFVALSYEDGSFAKVVSKSLKGTVHCLAVKIKTPAS